MVIVDSSVLIDYLGGYSNPETEWLDAQVSFRRIGITSLILTEVLQGIRDDARFAGTLKALSKFAIFEVGSNELAIQSARNYRTLRGLGVTIRSTVDCLVATFCIEQSHELLHHDSDFDSFEKHLGLRVMHPPALPLP
jgi:predicted nucleic acid-binding protein